MKYIQSIFRIFFKGTQLKINTQQFNIGSNSFVGWGRKRSGLQAIENAYNSKLSFLLLEDGFIRSLDLSVNGSPAFSIVEDDVGIYYDATVPSKLENLLIQFDVSLNSDLLTQARSNIGAILSNNLSKYNQSPNVPKGFFDCSENRVLVIAQTAGDSSLEYGLGLTFSTYEMLSKALTENPGSTIYLKVHPDVLSGQKQSDIDLIQLPDSIRVISEDFNPISLLRYFDKVYTKTSQMGFEALMLGKAVVCFGMPFYAGWGLTDDRVSCPRRVKKRTVEEVFAAAYILYSRYANPFTFQPSSLEETMRFMSDARNKLLTNEADWLVYGVSKWKRAFIPGFLGFRSSVQFIDNLQEMQANEQKSNQKVLVWAAGYTEAVQSDLAKQTWPVYLLEDGFLRSVGLGLNHAQPLSLVLDSRGMYYDCSKESDLEHILNTFEYDQAWLNRSASLITSVVNLKLTKYNLKSSKDTWRGSLLAAKATNKRIVLVPGQVETDASIRLGSPKIKTNNHLLKQVREDNPDDFVVYKPHPDVLTNLREGHLKTGDANFDLQITQADMAELLEYVDEVHTMTSLTGFEALLRGKKVVCYGLPFYAGWGLTEDLLTCERRTRTLKLEELVAGTLIQYPTYADPKTGHLIDVETAVELLRQQKDKGEIKLSFFKRLFRQVRTSVLMPLGLVRKK